MKQEFEGYDYSSREAQEAQRKYIEGLNLPVRQDPKAYNPKYAVTDDWTVLSPLEKGYTPERSDEMIRRLPTTKTAEWYYRPNQGSKRVYQLMPLVSFEVPGEPHAEPQYVSEDLMVKGDKDFVPLPLPSLTKGVVLTWRYTVIPEPLTVYIHDKPEEYTENQPEGSYWGSAKDDRGLKYYEIDYLGYTPDHKWKHPNERKYWIGRIHLQNHKVGTHAFHLSEAIGKYFGITGRSVRNYARFAESAKGYTVPGTKIRVKRPQKCEGDWYLKPYVVHSWAIPWKTLDGTAPMYQWMRPGRIAIGYMARTQELHLLQDERQV